MAQPSPVTYASSYSNSYRIYITVVPGTYNAAGYTPMTVYLVADATGSQWFDGWSCNGYLNISYTNSSGTTTALNWTENTSTSRSLSGPGGYYTARTATFNAYHVNGVCSFTVAASYGMNNQSQSYSMPQRTIGTQTYSLALPAAPAAPALTRTTDGASITITSAVPSSTVTITDYNYRYSTDDATWSSAQALGTGLTAVYSGTSTSLYYIQTRAGSANGWGAWSPSTSIAGVPSAPASVTADRTSTNVTVTATASATDGGSAILNYYVQSSTDGTNWNAAQLMSGLSYTYTALTVGTTYSFRVYSTNAIGNSATTAAGSSVLVAADGPPPTILFFNANPIYSNSYGHNQIRIAWTKPAGEWTHLALVRSTLGFPVTPDDGVLRLLVTPSEHDAIQFPLEDYGLVDNDIPLADNQVYYYTVFVRDVYSGLWGNAATTMAMSVKDYGTAEKMYEYLPLPYKTSVLNSGLTDITEVNSDLQNFLSIFGAEYDAFKASADNVAHRYDIAKLDGRLLPLMLQQFGMTYEAGLGLGQGRRMLQAFPYISLMRGVTRGVKAFVTAYTGYNATIKPVINLMLNTDDSSFSTGIGSWTAANGTISKVASGDGVTPYSESNSPSGFPNGTAGMLKYVASVGTATYVDCGVSDPVTKGIPVTAGLSYTVSLYARAITTAPSVTVGIKWYDQRGTYLSSSFGTPASSSLVAWARLTKTATAPTGAYFAVPSFYSTSGSGITQYIDAVQFEQASSASTFADARRVDIYLDPTRTNLAINPSFDDSSLGWIHSASGTLSKESGKLHPGGSSSGTYLMKAQSFTNAYVQSDGTAMSVTGGKTYTLSSYLARPAGTSADPALNQSVGISFVWYDGSSNLISETFSTYAGTVTAAKAVLVTAGTSGPWNVTYAVTKNSVSVGDRISVFDCSDPFYNWDNGGYGNLVTAVTATTVTVQVPEGTPVSELIENQNGYIKKIASVNVDSTTAKRVHITADAPTNAATVKVRITDLGNDSGVTDILVDGVLLEQAGDLKPYFDGSFGSTSQFAADNSYFNTPDIKWEDTLNSTGVSTFYLNRDAVNKRLLQVLPDYLASGTPWAIFYR